jgi:nicotinic acetylcholine receptor, invertebrate
MIITTNCWLTQDWIDSNLRWDPTKFNNIKFVHIPADKLWKPDILLGIFLKI